jgi:Na+/phosphate symporter
MPTESNQESLSDRLKALCPLVDNLRLMLGEARHAFNRHSLAKLAEIAELQDDLTLDLDPMFEQLEADLEGKSEADAPDLLKFKEILSHVEHLADRIAALAEPIRRKGNQGVILSDKDFFRVNDLFAQEMGLMRALVDIFLYGDASLKAYVLKESQSVRDTCFQEEVTHESRMMDSPGQHNAWAVYIAILERFGEISVHLLEIVKILE